MIRHTNIEDATAIARLIEFYMGDFAVNQLGQEKLNQASIAKLL